MRPQPSIGAAARPRIAGLLLLLVAATAATGEEYRPLRTGGLDAETAALLVSGQEGGSIPLFAAVVAGVAPADAKAAVEVYVEVSGPALLAGHEGDRLRLEICLYALQDARVADSSLETVELDLAVDRDRLLAGGAKLRSMLDLAAGEYVLRLLVRNARSRELGLRSLPLRVPDAGGEAVLQPPLAPDPPGAWLRLARSAAAPLIGFWPAARPVLAAEADAELQLLTRGVAPERARLRIGGAAGATVEVPATIGAAGGGAPDGFDRWRVRARLPALAPGDYELGVIVGEAAESPWLPIVVRSEPAGTWAGGGGPAPGPQTAPAATAPMPAPGEQRASRRQVEALKSRFAAAYRGALASLAAADDLRAIRDLERLESEAFGLEGGAAALSEVELESARGLAGDAVGSLPLLFDLHYRAYDRHLAARRFRLSSHSRDHLLELVDLYLAQKPPDTSPATDILALMAGRLQQAGLPRFSSELYRRALAIDPAHAAALLGYAAGLERLGEHGQAVELLERLVAAHPRHDEGKLRLAVNLARVGRRPAARRLLAELVETAEQDWVLGVAHHELTRDLFDRELLDEAEALARAGLERLPGDDQLRLLLSAIRDARREGSLGDALALGSRADRPSYRLRYQQWPAFALGADPQAAERRRQALAGALGSKEAA